MGVDPSTIIAGLGFLKSLVSGGGDDPQPVQASPEQSLLPQQRELLDPVKDRLKDWMTNPVGTVQAAPYQMTSVGVGGKKFSYTPGRHTNGQGDLYGQGGGAAAAKPTTTTPAVQAAPPASGGAPSSGNGGQMSPGGQPISTAGGVSVLDWQDPSRPQIAIGGGRYQTIGAPLAPNQQINNYNPFSGAPRPALFGPLGTASQPPVGGQGINAPGFSGGTVGGVPGGLTPQQLQSMGPEQVKQIVAKMTPQQKQQLLDMLGKI